MVSVARQAREKSPNGVYKVMLRGTEKLFAEKGDYERFKAAMEEHLTVYAYTLMKNTVCMLVKESVKGISRDIKPLTTSYARYFNTKYSKDGKLFLGRFKSEPVASEDFAHSAAEMGRLPKLVKDKTAFVGYDANVIDAELYESELKAAKTVGGFYNVLIKAEGVEKKLVEKKPVTKKAVTKKELAQPKIEEKQQKTEVKEPVVKPKKKKQMPSWLL